MSNVQGGNMGTPPDLYTETPVMNSLFIYYLLRELLVINLPLYLGPACFIHSFIQHLTLVKPLPLC